MKFFLIFLSLITFVNVYAVQTPTDLPVVRNNVCFVGESKDLQDLRVAALTLTVSFLEIFQATIEKELELKHPGFSPQFKLKLIKSITKVSDYQLACIQKYEKVLTEDFKNMLKGLAQEETAKLPDFKKKLQLKYGYEPPSQLSKDVKKIESGQ